MRPGDVVVQQVFGEDLPLMMLTDDQQPVEDFTAQCADDPLADGVARGACGGLARIRMPSAWNTASNESLNWPARSLISNLTEAARWPTSIRKLRAACVVRAPAGIGGDAGQVNTTSAVLDDDQGIDALEPDRVHVSESGCDDAAGLRGQELLPARALEPGSRVNPGIVQDLPDR
jgi:hypothetical protein